MIVSHKALHKVTRLLKLIPINTCPLLNMFLNPQSGKDANIVECQYPRTYEKGGQSLPFPDVEADDFSEVRRGSRYRVMAYEEKWYREFHDAIASDSAQTLMEAMSSVRTYVPIAGTYATAGQLLTRDAWCVQLLR